MDNNTQSFMSKVRQSILDLTQSRAFEINDDLTRKSIEDNVRSYLTNLSAQNKLETIIDKVPEDLESRLLVENIAIANGQITYPFEINCVDSERSGSSINLSVTLQPIVQVDQIHLQFFIE